MNVRNPSPQPPLSSHLLLWAERGLWSNFSSPAFRSKPSIAQVRKLRPGERQASQTQQGRGKEELGKATGVSAHTDVLL